MPSFILTGAPVLPHRIKPLASVKDTRFRAATALATRFIRSKLEHPRCHGYVAEKDGYVVGSVFVTGVDDCPAGAIGPLTVEPAHEGGVGAALMHEAVAEAARMGIGQLRLILLVLPTRQSGARSAE